MANLMKKSGTNSFKYASTILNHIGKLIRVKDHSK